LTSGFGEARVVVGDERREQGVAFRQGGGAGQPQFLDQPILQRLVGALDPAPCSSQGQALGRARIGADDVDVQGVQCPAELGHAVAAKRAWMVDPEDAMLAL
jgi:hypothetical protein